MRLFVAILLTAFTASTAVSEDIVIAFPVDPNSVEGLAPENVIGFLVIESTEKSEGIIASEGVLEAARTLNPTVDFLKIENSPYANLSIDIESYSTDENSTVRQYFVGVPDRFPGDNEYPGGGGGWWPPRIIWPPQGGSDDLEAATAPKPWPGGGGGWWPPRAAEAADTSENDVLRGIFINTESFRNAAQGDGIPIITME